MKNNNLLYIFLGLLAIYGISQLFNTQPERSFKAELIQVDTAKVDLISVDPKGEENKPYTLKRENGAWIASQDNINAKANSAAINALLKTILEIKTKQIAAKSPEKWPEYEVAEGSGSLIKVSSGSKVLEEFIIGRFSFDQQAKTATSYIRLKGEDEVYAVDGFLSVSLGQNFDTYRNKELLALKPEMDITAFSFETPEGQANFTRQDGQWLLNGETPLDSTKVANYLNGLKSLSGSTFADDFDDANADNLKFKTFTAKGNNITEPLSISCYRDTTRERPFVFQSSQNTEAFFDSDSTGLFKTIFKEPNEFKYEY